MKRAIALIFLFVFLSCGGSNSGVSQQGEDEARAESATTDFDECNALKYSSLKSFDECTGPLPTVLMDVEQELLEGVSSESVPYLQRNYLMNCMSRSDSSVDRSEIATTCRCLYQGLVDYLRVEGTETQAVLWFVELEEGLVEGGLPPAWAIEIYVACA
jgi:hypothetical protein